MSHITAILIVLTLTGSPVAGAVCAVVCGHGTVPAAQAQCHESMPATAETGVAAGPTCGTLSTDAPYLKEQVSAPRVLAAAALAHFIPRAGAASAPHAPAASLAAAWLKPPLTLRI